MSYNAGSSFTPIVQSHDASTVATPNTVGDLAWYPDSGATTHLTNDIARLAHS